PLPKDIHKILKSPCPFSFFPWYKIEDTHMLVLIPETVNGMPFDLTTLGKLVQAPKEGHATQFNFISIDNCKSFNDINGNLAMPKSHWVLMTKDVINGSRGQYYKSQQALIAKVNKKSGMNYEAPNVLAAATCIFMHYISSKERLFNNNLGTY